ncbi:MAG: hypothetical protein ACR2OE_09410, partial [Thermomicrobiales bacterium]
RMLEMFSNGLRLMDGHSPESRLGLEESVAFMSFWKQRIGAIFQEWEEERERVLSEHCNRDT